LTREIAVFEIRTRIAIIEPINRSKSFQPVGVEINKKADVDACRVQACVLEELKCEQTFRWPATLPGFGLHLTRI
jgi:hypothetical protein